MISTGRLHALWRALPFGSLDDVIGPGTCLVLAPHPDDESLGCGGLIAACCAIGRPPLVVILTDGSGSHPGSRQFPRSKLAALRAAEVTHAAGILGLPVDRLILLHERDADAPHGGPAFDRVVRQLAALVRAFACSAILAPWRHDPHCDHEAAAMMGCETARITGIKYLAYPIWGWLLPKGVVVEEPTVRGWRLDVTPHLPVKWRAIAAHASQHNGLIADDPTGFALPDALLSVFRTRWETFLLP
jgi:LmbE family N-acetylglucosaminyl deacetylase